MEQSQPTLEFGMAPQNPIGRFFHTIVYNATGSPLFWILFVGLLSSYPIIRALTADQNDPRRFKPPRVLGTIPEFTFTDETGKAFGSKDLIGQAWVANFFFTSCSSICPEMMQKMVHVRERLRQVKWMMRMVSITVDPTRDTPEVLLDYAKEHAGYFYDGKTWKFLTGELEQIDKVVIDGFKIAVSRPPEDQPSLFEITHGERFVLVDQRGQIRGYYKSDDEGIERLLVDISMVANNY